MRHGAARSFARISLPAVVLALQVLVTAASATQPCGAPVTGEDLPRANDCLFILRSSVGLEPCRACVCDTGGIGDSIGAGDAHLCLRAAVGMPDVLACPACLETTTTLAADTTTTTTLAGACPNVVEWTTHAGAGPACAADADCAAGACDTVTGHCRTSSELDLGWTGYGHDQDVHEGPVQRLRVQCDSEGPVCGECSVTGVDPSSGSCRCASDVRLACDEPFTSDPDCPGGGRCECHVAAPTLISAGGSPYCLVELFDSDPTGTVDVDLGAAEIVSARRLRVHLGLGTLSPCPTCAGRCSSETTKPCQRDDDCDPGDACDLDDVAGDGIRGGVCDSGATQGQPCDVTADNTSFPIRYGESGGGGYSIDCQPSVGSNVSGAGFRVVLRETTGKTALASDLSCGGGFAGLSCPCRACRFDPTVACRGDEDCAGLDGGCSGSSSVRCTDDDGCSDVDAGPCIKISSTFRCSDALSVTCTTNDDCTGFDFGACLASTCSAGPDSQVAQVQPSSCVDHACTDLGAGEGECTNGPDLRFCSNLLTASGRGVMACALNGDCEGAVIHVAGSESCTHVERQRCFPDPVTADGAADPTAPLLVATFCAPPTSKRSFNEILGLPGPVRLRRQTTMRSWCGAAPYEPGVGGCLP